MTAWKVIQRAAGANLSVDIQQGDGVIDISSSHLYTGWVASTDKNIPVTAADPSNPRIDRVVAYIDLASISTAVTNNTGALIFKAVAGTAAGSPTAPSDGDVQTSVGASNPYVDLAQLAVAAGATTVVTANITDKRPSMAVRAPLAPAITTITVSTVLSYAYDVVKADATAGAITATLPDATLQAGRKFTIYKSDTSANAVTVACNGSQTIMGEPTVILPERFSLLEVMSDGTNWQLQRLVKSAYRFRAYKAAATTLTLSAGVATKINCATESYDPNADYDAATNFRYTANVTGTHHFDAAFQGSASIGANHRDEAYLYKNGAQAVIGSIIGHVANTNNFGAVSGDIALVAGDYVEFYGFSSAGGQADGAANGAQTHFSGRLVL